MIIGYLNDNVWQINADLSATREEIPSEEARTLGKIAADLEESFGFLDVASLPIGWEEKILEIGAARSENGEDLLSPTAIREELTSHGKIIFSVPTGNSLATVKKLFLL